MSTSFNHESTSWGSFFRYSRNASHSDCGSTWMPGADSSSVASGVGSLTGGSVGGIESFSGCCSDGAVFSML